MKSRVLTYIVTADNITKLPEAIVNRLGCNISNNDLLSMNVRNDGASVSAVITVYNNSLNPKFDESTSL